MGIHSGYSLDHLQGMDREKSSRWLSGSTKERFSPSISKSAAWRCLSHGYPETDIWKPCSGSCGIPGSPFLSCPLLNHELPDEWPRSVGIFTDECPTIPNPYPAGCSGALWCAQPTECMAMDFRTSSIGNNRGAQTKEAIPASRHYLLCFETKPCASLSAALQLDANDVYFLTVIGAPVVPA
jgi:hypothetical protein